MNQDIQDIVLHYIIFHLRNKHHVLMVNGFVMDVGVIVHGGLAHFHNNYGGGHNGVIYSILLRIICYSL